MNHSKTDILIAISGDLRLHTRAVEEICLPFLHPDVGMVGSHPVPINTQHNPIGPQIRLLWKLHHLVSLQTPKCGEMVAFRKVIKSIPKESAVDEATLEVLMHMVGYKIVYAPRAIVYNKGPRNVHDFLKQRRRVYVGHKWVGQQYHYHVSTMKTGSTAAVIRQYLLSHPEDIINMVKLVSLEAVGRMLGWIDFYILGKNPFIWDMVKRE
jgi:cellulose synthase/poly-beta-1,6-N-acetylglucosamine synthase-like glycosyltransferase